MKSSVRRFLKVRQGISRKLIVFLITLSISLTSLFHLPLRLTQPWVSFNFKQSSRRSEHLLRSTWGQVIDSFMTTAPIVSFSTSAIISAYAENKSDLQNTSVLITIENGRPNITENFNGKRHTRKPSVYYIIQKILTENKKMVKRLPKRLVFLVCVNDGINPNVAIFGSARHWKNWHTMIPVPMGNDRGYKQGWGSTLELWDSYIEKGVLASHAHYPWNSKKPKAMFRGVLRMQRHMLGSCNQENGHRCTPATSWRDVNRGRLYLEAAKRPEQFDIGFLGNGSLEGEAADPFEGAPPRASDVPYFESMKYKLLLNVGSNADWAERMRMLMITNSAVVKHEAETQEFFYPLLRAWTHYIPTDIYFSDLVRNVEWALQHERATRKIVRNANRFAETYLSEKSMQIYWEQALLRFARIQYRADQIRH